MRGSSTSLLADLAKGKLYGSSPFGGRAIVDCCRTERPSILEGRGRLSNRSAELVCRASDCFGSDSGNLDVCRKVAEGN